MELNRRDEKKYIDFLDQIESFNDKRLSVYGYIINDFIKKNYKSNDNSSYDIDDFIQEAFALLYSKQEQIEEVDNELKNLYNRMNNEENKESNEEVIFKINLKKYMKSIEDKKEKEVLKALLLDEDLNEVANKMNISNDDIKDIMIKLLQDTKKYLNENRYIIEKKNNNNNKTK